MKGIYLYSIWTFVWFILYKCKLITISPIVSLIYNCIVIIVLYYVLYKPIISPTYFVVLLFIHFIPILFVKLEITENILFINFIVFLIYLCVLKIYKTNIIEIYFKRYPKWLKQLKHKSFNTNVIARLKLLYL